MTKNTYVMSAKKEHIVQEKLDLDNKITALGALVKGPNWLTFKRRERRILEQQLDAMEVYSFLLDSRIKFLKKAEQIKAEQIKAEQIKAEQIKP
jgi:hypothetical protein